MKMAVLIAATLSAFLGWTLGTSKVPTVSASQGVSIHVYSGALYGASYLTCGWHTVCDGSPNYERGLDFATPNFYFDKKGYFTGWAFSGDSQDTVRATGVMGDTRPMELRNCITTSVDIRDTLGVFQVRIYYVHVSRTRFSQFDILAKQFGLGGHWNGDVEVGNQITQTGCTGRGTDPRHAMTWYDGLVDGVFNIFPRDSWWNCPNTSGFYFPCWDVSPYQLPHDLNDWAYLMSW